MSHEHASPTTSVFFDIETIPDQTEGAMERAGTRVKVPGNYSKPDTIKKFVEDNTEKVYRETSLDGTYGHVISISYGIGRRPITVLAPSSEAFRVGLTSADGFDFIGFERRLLTRFWNDLRTAIGTSRIEWVGHYITAFDMPFLLKRSIVHRLMPVDQFPRNPKPWANDVFDTWIEWTGDRTRHIKLNELARVLSLGMDKHGDMDGSEVWDAVQAGRIKELGMYCRRDVELARAIYYAMRYMSDVPEDSEAWTAT